MRKNKKGFTLVELLAVIVVLAIIMVIAIPAVMSSLNKAKKNTFASYAKKIYNAAVNKYTVDENFELSFTSGVNVYDIKTDLGLSSTGNYEGYVLIDSRDRENVKYIITLYDSNYELLLYDSTTNGLPEEKSTSIKNLNSNHITGRYDSKTNICKSYTGSVDCAGSSSNTGGPKVVTLVEGNNEQSKTVYENTTIFTLSNISGYTNVYANNGAELSYTSNTLTVSNLNTDTKIILSNTLKNTIDKTDTSKNYILMLNDENNSSKSVVKKNQNIVLNLNGKKIKSSGINITDSTWKNEYKVIEVIGTLQIDDDTNQGGLYTGIPSVALNVKGGNLTINGGIFEGRQAICVLYDNANLTINNGIFYSLANNVINFDGNDGKNQKIVINGGEFVAPAGYSTISIQQNSNNNSLTINNGVFRNTSSHVIYVGSDNYANIYLNGGIYIAKVIPIKNQGYGTIYISQTDKPMYISSTYKGRNPAVQNNNHGIINIKGHIANKCSSNYEETTSGLCIYAEGMADYSLTNVENNFGVENVNDGEINIDGAYIYGGSQGISQTRNGIIRVKNSYVSSGRYGILNHNDSGKVEGKIYICNTEININPSYSLRHLHNNNVGYIYYSNDTKFSGKSNTLISYGSNIISNYTGLCS